MSSILNFNKEQLRAIGEKPRGNVTSFWDKTTTMKESFRLIVYRGQIHCRQRLAILLYWLCKEAEVEEEEEPGKCFNAAGGSDGYHRRRDVDNKKKKLAWRKKRERATDLHSFKVLPWARQPQFPFIVNKYMRSFIVHLLQVFADVDQYNNRPKTWRTLPTLCWMSKVKEMTDTISHWALAIQWRSCHAWLI